MTWAWIVRTQTGSSTTACAVGVLTAFNRCWATSRTGCRLGAPPGIRTRNLRIKRMPRWLSGIFRGRRMGLLMGWNGRWIGSLAPPTT
jgi:hypothetical protein